MYAINYRTVVGDLIINQVMNVSDNGTTYYQVSGIDVPMFVPWQKHHIILAPSLNLEPIGCTEFIPDVEETDVVFQQVDKTDCPICEHNRKET